MDVININADKGHKILGKCRILREYSIFIDTIRKYAKEEGAIKRAVNECIEKGILADYLRRKGSEVRNMLTAEYSYERDIQVKQQEARQEGMREGMREGIQEGIREGIQKGLLLSGNIIRELKTGLSDSEIAEKWGCREEEVSNLRKIFEK